MNRKINCSILTPEKTLFEGDIEFAVVQAFDGEKGFLFNHAPLISELGIGEIRLRDVQSMQQFYIDGGVVEIHDNSMIILAVTAQKKEELNKSEIDAKLKQLYDKQPQKFSKEWSTLQIDSHKLKVQLKIAAN